MRAAVIACAGLVLAGASVAMADTVNFAPGLENWGANDPDGNGASASVIWTETFSLPAVSSINSATFELAHSFLSDLHLTLTSPGGDEFLFARGRSSQNVAPFNAAFDAGDLGNGGSTLGGAANYTFAEAGAVWNDGNGNTSPAANGTFASVAWVSGGFAAGDWTITLIDAWDTLDDGALGDVSVDYTPVPTPGVAGLLALGGLVGARRRRA